MKPQQKTVQACSDTVHSHYTLFVGQKSRNSSLMNPYFKNTRDIQKCFRKMALPFEVLT